MGQRPLWSVCATALALFLFVFLLQASIPQVPAGYWASAGMMSSARTGAASVLLPDGRVLITGGGDSNGAALTSAEFFNPDGSFSPASPMGSARSHHAAVLLQDGRVLVTGGATSGGGITNAAEIYDPGMNTWTAVSSMQDARSGHTSSNLQDGRVLLAGGQGASGPLSSLEIFDPSTNSFSFAGTLAAARQDHAAAVLQDGRVLITGGSGVASGGSTITLNSVEVFDPSSNSVAQGASLATARARHSATALLNGNVVVIGGNDGSNDLASAEVYDSTTGAWSATGSLLTARSGHQALLLPNNANVLIAGGTSAGADLASAELFVPWGGAAQTGTFQTTGSMSAARSGPIASPLQQDGVALVGGGSNLASSELYGFATVKTDLLDYAPGQIVTITGSGWQPGETVTLTLVEVPNLDTHPPMTVAADVNGNIFNNAFSPDIHDLNIRFYLTASGSVSQAQTTFTDSVTLQSVTVGPQSPSAIASGASATYNPVTLSFTGNGSTGCTVTLSVSGLPAGAIPSFGSNPVNGTGSGSSPTTTLTISTTGATPAGTHSFTVQATAPNVPGGQGCNGPTTKTTTATLFVDNTPPTVTINQAAGQADPTKNSPINFTVVFSEPVADFATGDVTLSGAAGATTATVSGGPTTYNVAVSGMTTDGTVIASIAAGVAHDTAGNPNTASTSTDNTVTYDTTPPAVPSTPDMSSASDSGSSNTDNITNVQKPIFTGTEADNGTTVTLLVDGVANGTAVTALGIWTITAANNIADGTHSVTATATDAAGNVSSPSGALSITIDTTVAAPSIPALDPASDSGSSNSDNITSVTTPTFKGTAEANAMVELFRTGSTSLGTTTANGTGSWSLTVGSPLADGTYSITAKQTDVAGNVSAASAALSITIDTVAPAAPTSPNLVAASDSGISNSDNITNQTVNLQFQGSAEASAAITIFDGATQVATGNANNGGNWNITAAGPFTEGSHSLTAKATDAAGNVSAASAPHTVTIDTTRPTVTINQAVGQADPAATGPINFTVVFSEPAFGFTTGDVTLSGTAGATTATVTGSGTTYNVAVTGMTQAGTVIASINQNVATDTAGNGNTASTSTDNTVTYNPDSTPPVVTVTFPSPVHGTNGWFNAQDSVPVVGTVSANDTTTGNSNVSAISCTDGVNPLPVGSLSGIGTHVASGSLSVAGDGTHNISCQATDSAGNSGAGPGSTNSATIKIDTLAPSSVVGAAARPADHNGWYNAPVAITFSGADLTSGIAICTTTNYSGPDSATASAAGHCTDNAGNTSADATFNFKFDSTPPTGVALSVTVGTAGANGWYTSDVTVHTAGTELVSGPAICTADQFQTTETVGQVFNGSCTNDAGLSTNASALTVKLDKTGPSANLTVSAGTLGTNGWYTTDVTVHASGNDTISSPVSCTSDQVISTETAGTSVNGSCTNEAGLSTNATPLPIKLDKTAPVVTLAVTAGAAGANGWYTSDVTVRTSGTETISSPISCSADQFQTSETTGAAFNGSCTNDAGLTGSAAPLTVKLDKTGPTATLAVTAGTLGDNGWYVSDVTVHAAGTDSISSPVTCTADQFLTTDSTGYLFSASCTNDAGLTTNAADLTVKRDATPPAVHITPDRAADHNGWYNHTLSFTNPGTDATSGIASCTTPAAYSGPDSASVSVSASCKDQAGNIGNGSFSFMFDATAPTGVAGAAARVADHNGWYNAPVAITFSGTDATSGIESCSNVYYSGPDSATASAAGHCTDNAGNTSADATFNFKFDSTAPTGVALSVTVGTAGANGWYTSDVTVHTAGTELVSGPAICTADQFQTTETVGQVFNGSCTNDAGLTGNATPLTVKLDKTPPTGVALSVTSGTLGNNGWYVSDVTVHTDGTDSISSPVSCTPDQFQTSDTTGTVFNGLCTNQAGLTATAVPLTIKRDKTPPSLSPSISPNPAILHGSATSSAGATDSTSGIASQSCGAVDTSTVGAKTLICTATDNAGNSNSMTVSYSVIYSTGPCLGSPGHAILQPIDFTGASVFPKKQGSTVPAKFRVCDALGNSIGVAGVVSDFKIIQVLTGTVSTYPNEDVASTTPDTAFRWDPSGGQWIYNISTKPLNAGSTYFFRISLNDGTNIDFDFGLK